MFSATHFQQVTIKMLILLIINNIQPSKSRKNKHNIYKYNERVSACRISRLFLYPF